MNVFHFFSRLVTVFRRQKGEDEVRRGKTASEGGKTAGEYGRTAYPGLYRESET